MLISLPLSLYIIQSTIPTYKASAVIEISESSTGASSRMTGSVRFLQNILSDGDLGKTSSGSLIPKILGNEFLSKYVLSNKKFKTYIDENCRYTPPTLLTLTGFLDVIGVYKQITLPSRLASFKIDCLKKSYQFKNTSMEK